MTSSVRISRKAARFLVVAIERAGWRGPSALLAVADLKAALSRKPLKPAKKLARQAKAQKKATRRESWVAIRKEVAERANGKCECGCGCLFSETYFRQPDPDHFFGKARAPESVRNVWMLTRECHGEKHAGLPSPWVWHERFIRHCIRYGYVAEAARAQARLDSLRLAFQAESVGQAAKEHGHV